MNKRIEYVTIGLLFSSLLLLGLCRYRDYGISIDEPAQRLTGAVTVKYLAETFQTPGFMTWWKQGIPALPQHQDRDYAVAFEAPAFALEEKRDIPALAQHQDRDYGVAFEAPAFALEHLFRLHDPRSVYMFRHLLTFLVSLVGVCAAYRLSLRRFLDWRIGLLSALFLVLTPRLFAESFYNSKDIVFMAVFAVAMNTAIAFVLRPRVKTAFLHALATAVAVDLRITGLLLVVVSVLLLIVRVIRRELRPGRTCLISAAYIIVAFAFVILMWPYLWSRPLGHFLQAFENMARFRWGGEVRYMGALIRTTALPWHYTFTWISITTPLLYLALFVVGAYATCRRILACGARLWQDDGELQDMVFLGFFFAPILAVLLFHSVLYDGWRQLYFVYPAFLLLATKGWVTLWSIKSTRNIYKASLVTLTTISVCLTAMWMWKAHPLENVYFNMLAGNNVKARYEVDYWGLANRRALEYILERDHSPVVNVWADSMTPISYSVLMLKREDRWRVRVGNDKRVPFYVLTNYRQVRDIDSAKYDRDYQLFYEIRVDDELVLSVFKWKGPATENSCLGDNPRRETEVAE
ncbi:MAG TPA: hypothetical protein VK673_09240 [Chthoniobacterales bacterium]|nr:hypothetical protein [Chthoniobacterales bacterium]